MDNAKNVKLHTDFAVDWQLLQQVQSITLNSQNEATFKHGTIGNFDTFLEVYMKHSPCNTCSKPAKGSWTVRFPHLDKILKTMLTVYPDYQQTPDFTSSFYGGEVMAKGTPPDYSDAIGKRDGGQFMLRYMQDSVSNAVMIDRKFKYVNPNAHNPDKEFDIYLGDDDIQDIWFIECKSYSESSQIDIEQMLSYFSSIKNLGNLRYAFNKDKMTLDQAKASVQSLLYSGDKLTANGEKLFEVIWTNEDLRVSLFEKGKDKDEAMSFFEVLLSKHASFFNFITVH